MFFCGQFPPLGRRHVLFTVDPGDKAPNYILRSSALAKQDLSQYGGCRFLRLGKFFNWLQRKAVKGKPPFCAVPCKRETPMWYVGAKQIFSKEALKGENGRV